MPASQEQKVDFLLKKIGYSASKTGVAEDESTIGLSTNTAKKPFEEGIPSPLVIPSTTILSDSSFIPTTPPGSDTLYVKGYRTATALRMTRDATVGTNTRSYIAYTTYNDTSSARLTNWIDTQFGSSYIIKVFKGDPNSSGVELQQAGGNAGTDGWFFDYSSGILNFNGINLPDGVTATNIYIVGYRYIGATGVQPPAGIGTFHDLVVHNNLHVSGISTFVGAMNVANGSGVIEDAGGQLKIKASTFNFRNNLDNKNIIFATGTGGVILYNHGQQKLETLGYGITVFGTTQTPQLNVSGISTFSGLVDVNAELNTTGGRIVGAAVSNVIPFYYDNASEFPSASTYHGAVAHAHNTGRLYFAHAGWKELVNREATGIVGTGTERYDIGYLDATNLYVSGITTLGSIGISTGLISGPAITYIDPATVGDNTGTLVVKGNLQVEGTQTTVNSTTMNVADKNVGIASGAANDAAADGAGLTVYAGSNTDKTWQWLDATDSWTSSEHIRIPDDKVIGFATDTDTHISRPVADQLLLTTGGAGKARFLTTQTKIGPDADSATASTNYEFQISGHNGGNCFALSLKHPNTSVGANLRQAFFFKNSGNTPVDLVKFQAECTANTAGSESGDLAIYTTNSGSSTEKVRITGIGSVGINSTAPTALLDVKGTANIGEDGQLEVNHTGQVILKYQNSSRLSTNGQGGTFLGNLNFIGNGYKATFGASGELEILNLSNMSLVRDIRAGVGTLAIEADNVLLRNKGGSQNYLEATDDAGVKLNFAGAQKLETTGIGISVPNINVTGITTTLQLQVGTLGHTMVGITTILDEDDMASNSATALVTQQSLVAYVGNSAPGGSALSVSADSGSNESINLNTEVLDIEGTANEIETVTGTNKVVIGLPDNVSIGGTLSVNNDLNVTGVSTFNKLIDANGRIVGIQTNSIIPFYYDNVSDFPSAATYHGAFAHAHNTGKAYFAHAGWKEIVSKEANGTIGVGTEVYNIGVTSISTLNVGDTTFTGTISAGSTTGIDGYYLKSVGTGVTWAQFPTVRTGLTTTATAGQTTFNFSYNVGFVDVFVNGVKLPSSEFTASSGSTIVLDDAAFANDTLEFISLNTVPGSSSGGASNLNGLADVTITGAPVVGETLQHNGSEFVNDYTVTATTTSTSQTAILSLPVATYRSAEYTIQVTEGTKYHVTKVLAIHDGTNVTFNEYGTLFTTSSLSTFALDVSSGNMRLLATPASTNSTAFKVKFTAIKV